MWSGTKAAPRSRLIRNTSAGFPLRSVQVYVLPRGNPTSSTSGTCRHPAKWSMPSGAGPLESAISEQPTPPYDGQQPPGLTAEKLMRNTRLPLSWEAQRKRLGFKHA